MHDLRSGYELILREFSPKACTVHLLEERDTIIVAPARDNRVLYVTREDVERMSALELMMWLSERMRECP